MDVEDRAASAVGAAVVRIAAEAEGDRRAWYEPDGAAQAFAREGARLAPGIECALVIVDHGSRFRVAAATGALQAALAGASGDLTTTQLAGAAQGGVAEVLVPDAAAGDVLGSALAGAGVQRMWVRPLLEPAEDPHRLLGVLLATRRDDGDFGAEDRRALDTYATLVTMRLSLMLQNARIARRTRRLELGVELALDVAGAAHPRDANERVLARVVDVLEVDRAGLLRYEGGTAVVEALLDIGAASTNPYQYRVADQPPVRRALETRELVIDEPAFSSSLPPELAPAALSTRHFAVLPLLYDGSVIGFLNVARRRDVPFDDDDIEMLQVIGRVIGATLRNARLLADTRQARTAMSEFLRVIMHELRGPLTIIGGYLSMIEEGVFGEIPQGWSKPLETMDSKVREAQRLVDELLLASRLEDGNLPVREEEVDVSRAIRRALDRALPRAQLLHAGMRSDGGPGMIACADSAHVDRILDNLINNALTYGGQPPSVRVHVELSAGVVVTVEDNGPGVDDADRPRIFERFYRGRGTGPGMGLGLYLSRLLAERCGGSLELDSATPGAGATFRLRLPVVAATRQ